MPIGKPFGLIRHVLLKSVPAKAEGATVLTVTTTLSLAVHPSAVFVAVKTYVVVVDGLAVGLEAFGSFNPVAGVQL